MKPEVFFRPTGEFSRYANGELDFFSKIIDLFYLFIFRWNIMFQKNMTSYSLKIYDFDQIKFLHKTAKCRLIQEFFLTRAQMVFDKQI